jgi:hypothetical protein
MNVSSRSLELKVQRGAQLPEAKVLVQAKTVRAATRSQQRAAALSAWRFPCLLSNFADPRKAHTNLKNQLLTLTH